MVVQQVSSVSMSSVSISSVSMSSVSMSSIYINVPLINVRLSPLYKTPGTQLEKEFQEYIRSWAHEFQPELDACASQLLQIILGPEAGVRQMYDQLFTRVNAVVTKKGKPIIRSTTSEKEKDGEEKYDKYDKYGTTHSKDTDDPFGDSILAHETALYRLSGAAQMHPSSGVGLAPSSDAAHGGGMKSNTNTNAGIGAYKQPPGYSQVWENKQNMKNTNTKQKRFVSGQMLRGDSVGAAADSTIVMPQQSVYHQEMLRLKRG